MTPGPFRKRIGARPVLTRSLQHAEIVRAAEATDVFEERGLDAAEGVRQPMEEYVAATGRRILESAFMEIKQSVGLPRGLDGDAVSAVAAFVEQLKASGFVGDELARSGVQAKPVWTRIREGTSGRHFNPARPTH